MHLTGVCGKIKAETGTERRFCTRPSKVSALSFRSIDTSVGYFHYYRQSDESSPMPDYLVETVAAFLASTL